MHHLNHLVLIKILPGIKGCPMRRREIPVFFLYDGCWTSQGLSKNWELL